jgi:hypothetical protein
VKNSSKTDVKNVAVMVGLIEIEAAVLTNKILLFAAAAPGTGWTNI